eukprot:TRINITY_DN25361_c0_g1_i3.p1 TRINITY_DN25361_c0_g1~~TRINITY_DN25361_c0_g1_i3.p1  ORF type:complete len:379 (+),score=27.59 TRINITY_DN25361_c0_g1_i3:75-1139(+)
MFILTKYRPENLDDFKIHADIAQNLKQLASEGDMPHCLLYGPSGAGKQTLIRALLKEIYGEQVLKVKVETKPWVIELPNRKITVEMTCVGSNYHVEFVPSDAGFQDRYIVQEVVKQIAAEQGIGIQKFKTIFIKCADRLSQGAQHSLRRTMETFSRNARIILSCNNLAGITDPLQSRCLCIRVPLPSKDEVQSLLKTAVEQEGYQQVSDQFIERLLKSTGCNMRKALMALEATAAVNNGILADNTQLVQTTWETEIREIAQMIVNRQSHEQIYKVREQLYSLLVKTIPGTVILERLLAEFMSMRQLDDSVKSEIIKHAANSSQDMVLATKEIFVLEAFVTQIMASYQSFLSTYF